MERRDFLRRSLALGAAGAAGAGVPLAALRTDRPAATPTGGVPRAGSGAAPPRVDGARLNADVQALRRFGGTPDGGTHRVAYSDEDLAGRAWVAERMREAGLTVRIDPAGNLVGELAGADPSLPPLALGSHIDTVPFGGSYDGTIGVMGAVEIVRALHEAGHRLRHPLRLYDFQNEEGGKTGSRLLIGHVAPEELAVVTASGLTIGEGIARLGGDLHDLAAARLAPGSLAAFLELHIEQGATLERAGIPVGVVEGIVGIRRWFVTVTGEQNHAGTTPMAQRRDALVAASRMVVAIHETARTLPGRQVATVGRVEVDPGAANVIPGSVRFTLEIRDLTMDGIDAVFAAVRERAASIARETGTTAAFEPYYLSEAAPTAEPLRRHLEAAADAIALRHLRLPSGAGHDAQSMARLCPIAMVFVPSRGGVSHAPGEYTAPDQITAGVEVLMGALLHTDAGGDEATPGA
ncbi:MAG: Zn-dependent hydrolase [Longimicrobiales bacterium]|nr:Zn-dependent hydrolase [Longimicrobiales bacterium]